MREETATIEPVRKSHFEHNGTIEETNNGYQAVCQCKDKARKWKSKSVPYRSLAFDLLRDHYGILHNVEDDEDETSSKRFK